MQDCIQDTLSSRARLAWRPSARASKGILHTICNISLITCALGLKAARPSARATIGYLVYNRGKSTFFTAGHLLVYAASEKDLSVNVNKSFNSNEQCEILF